MGIWMAYRVKTTTLKKTYERQPVLCKNRTTEKHGKRKLPYTDASSHVRRSYVLVCTLSSVFLSGRSVYRSAFNGCSKRHPDSVAKAANSRTTAQGASAEAFLA